MLFSSLTFLFYFLPLVLVLYYISDRKYKNHILLAFSLFFYGYGGMKYLIVMIGSILINYGLGILVNKYRTNHKKIKPILVVSVLANLGILFYYKYTNFFLDNINNFLNLDIKMLNVIMPIGISFFTFQGLSYVLDVYKERGKVQKNPLNVALYISLFPQLIAGPIVRYETVAEEIDNRKESLESFSYGIERFVLGLSKKILIANTMGYIADTIFNGVNGNYSVTMFWIGAISYSLQIYYDFSGYSDMAIGLGKMFGFNFLENFNYPYISKSVSEFWRRWHISLGSFFRDYVYIPLGGNRVSTVRNIINLFVVWGLTGFWHGANWTFIAWGLYFGIILVVEKFGLNKILSKLPSFVQHFYALILIIFGWVLFRSENINDSVLYISGMLGLLDNPIFNMSDLFYIMNYKLEFILGIACSAPIYKVIKDKLIKIKSRKIQFILTHLIEPIFILFLFILSIMALTDSTFNPFIYFRF